MKHFVLYFLILFSVYSCKKDTITNYSVNGQVYNLSTDSGITNVTVFLNMYSSSGNSSLSTTSGANGNFSFNNVPVHSNSDYTYSLNIPSNSAGGYKPAIDGSTINIDKSKINQKQILNVVPRTASWKLHFPAGTHIAITDTFKLTIQQNIVHANLPSWNYKLIEGDCPTYPPPTSNYIDNVGSYWMGRWYSRLDRTQNGLHIIKTDSFYIGWGAYQTDTIPW
jgi:hypothetical protein